MLEMPLLGSDRRRHVTEVASSTSLAGDLIATGEHCYGCTAGQGSSCG